MAFNLEDDEKKVCVRIGHCFVLKAVLSTTHDLRALGGGFLLLGASFTAGGGATMNFCFFCFSACPQCVS